jgi:tetratricopeptide (TPR) repeat protein
VVGDRALRDRDLLQRNREILRTDPNNVDALNTVAWMLATNPDAALRDGGQALELARRALAHSAGDARISVLDTLAAAQAETGDFGKALETAQQGLALAAQAKRGQAVSLLERGIALYREGQPFRDV